jgi:capsular exopolysaccharide synthesis family protein
LVVEHYSAVSDYLSSTAQLEVIKDPVVPVVPSNPLNIRDKYPLVVGIAALLGVAIVAVLSALRDTVQTPKAARRKLDARLLRTIHHEERNKTARSKFRRKNAAPLISSPLISKTFIEDNLNLCSAVDYHMRKREQKIMLVTSAGENEGKSTVAANMALSMAKKGKKVLLLDCDFRKPSLHKIFEIPVQNDRTLTTFLLHDDMGPVPYLNQLKKHGIFLGLSHSSNRNITRLLNNGKLPALLKHLRERVDYVILDTPPMLAAADAEAIAAMVDTAVLVVRSDFMPTGAVNDGLDRLRKSAPDVCGFVLNNYYTTIL